MNASHSTGDTLARPISNGDAWLRDGMVIVLALAVLRLGLLLATANRYGYFGDEMYYLACGEHLDWGYVDQPPLIALVAWIVRHTLGDSLFALHVIPAVCGAAKVVLTGVLAKELGARCFGMTLAALAVFATFVYWPLDHLFTMNTFEPLIWMGCAYVVIRVIKTGNQKLWVWFGLLSGLGLQNKYSMLIFGFAVFVALLLTPERRVFFHKWVWLAAGIALVIFLPNLVWNIQHHWPFLELMRNIKASGRDVQLGPMRFLLQQVIIMNPATLPIWMAGLLYLLLSSDAKRFRALAWTFIITLSVLLAFRAKDYYMAPAYLMLFAAGGIALENFIRRTGKHRLKLVIVAVLVATLLPLLPMGIPLLEPEVFMRYQAKLPFQFQASEKSHVSEPMPHYYSWAFGWREMVSKVARVYQDLPAEERLRTAIFASNFAEAGAVDLFGPSLGLPKTISGHQSYWLWGPRHYTGENMILIGVSHSAAEKRFREVTAVAQPYHPFAPPWENRPILLGRKPYANLPDIWPELKNWD